MVQNLLNQHIPFYSLLRKTRKKIHESELIELINKKDINSLISEGYIELEQYAYCKYCNNEIENDNEYCFYCNTKEDIVNDPYYFPKEKFIAELYSTMKENLKSSDYKIYQDYSKNFIIFTPKKSFKKGIIVIFDFELTDYDFFANYGMNSINNIFWMIFISSNCTDYIMDLTENIYQSIMIIKPNELIDFLENFNIKIQGLFDREPNKILYRQAGLSNLLGLEVKHSSEILKLALLDQKQTSITDIILSAFQTDSAKSFYGSPQNIGINFDEEFCRFFLLINPNSFSIGGANYPDVISYFEIKNEPSRLAYISLKTSKREYEISKDDIEEVTPHLSKLIKSKEIGEYDLKYILFIVPEMKKKINLEYYSNQIRTRINKNIDIFYISIIVLLKYAIEFKNYLSDFHFDPNIFLEFLNYCNGYLITDPRKVESFFNEERPSKKKFLKNLIKFELKQNKL